MFTLKWFAISAVAIATGSILLWQAEQGIGHRVLSDGIAAPTTDGTGNGPATHIVASARTTPGFSLPEMPAPRDAPLSSVKQVAPAVPVLAAILPAAAEISRGLQYALSASLGEPAATTSISTRISGLRDWQVRTPDSRNEIVSPPEPLFAAIQRGAGESDLLVSPYLDAESPGVPHAPRIATEVWSSSRSSGGVIWVPDEADFTPRPVTLLPKAFRPLLSGRRDSETRSAMAPTQAFAPNRRSLLASLDHRSWFERQESPHKPNAVPDLTASSTGSHNSDAALVSIGASARSSASSHAFLPVVHRRHSPQLHSAQTLSATLSALPAEFALGPSAASPLHSVPSADSSRLRSPGNLIQPGPSLTGLAVPGNDPATVGRIESFPQQTGTMHPAIPDWRPQEFSDSQPVPTAIRIVQPSRVPHRPVTDSVVHRPLQKSQDPPRRPESAHALTVALSRLRDHDVGTMSFGELDTDPSALQSVVRTVHHRDSPVVLGIQMVSASISSEPPESRLDTLYALLHRILPDKRPTPAQAPAAPPESGSSLIKSRSLNEGIEKSSGTNAIPIRAAAIPPAMPTRFPSEFNNSPPVAAMIRHERTVVPPRSLPTSSYRHPPHERPELPSAISELPQPDSRSLLAIAAIQPDTNAELPSDPRLPRQPPAYGLAIDALPHVADESSATESRADSAPKLVRYGVEISRGDSLVTLLDNHAVSQSASLNAIRRLQPRLDPRRIRAGDRVSFVLRSLDGKVSIEELTVERTGTRDRRHHWTSGSFSPEDLVDPDRDGTAEPKEIEPELLTSAPGSGPLGDSAGRAATASSETASLFRHTMTVRSGDSLLGLLQGSEVSTKDALSAIRSLEPAFNPARLQIGDRVSLVIDSPSLSEKEEAESRILELSVTPRARLRTIHKWTSGESLAARPVLEIVDGIASLEAPRLELSEIIQVEGRIAASFYRAAEQAGVSPAEIRNIVQILSSNVNFRRDIQKGDSFEALLQRPPGGPAKILFVALRNGARTFTYYRADFADGSFGYFDPDGRSSLNLITNRPLAGAAVTSKFGYRIHPVRGHRHFHTGVDFRAPPRTPIPAAGNGVVIIKGWRGGFGRYLRIRHNGSYTTAYAHLHDYAEGIRPGKHVKRGEIIGYVGSSGTSTGYHLHFEIFEDGKPIDPLKLRNVPAPMLTGDQLTAFQDVRKEVDSTLEKLRIGSLASVDGSEVASIPDWHRAPD